MRKLFVLFALCLLTGIAGAQSGVQEKRPFILPGKGRINVEELNRFVNTKMDISQLSLSELLVLRNAFAARQGYAFPEGELRSIFETTSWYDKALWNRFEREEKMNQTSDGSPRDGRYVYLPIKYTKQEQAFVNRLREREYELLSDSGNYKSANAGWRVNLDNLVNPYQLETFDPQLRDALGRNGFAIVPDNKMQLFHIYEKNDYHDFPSFVSTDLYLQTFHLFFDAALRSIEEEKFSAVVADLCQQLYNRMGAYAQETKNADVKAAAEYDQTYAAIALSLVTGDALLPVPKAYKKMAADELQKVLAGADDFSAFLEYTDVKFGYSLFRPRGHYSRSETVQRYFRAMMWLQTVPFCINKVHQLKRAALFAEAVNTDSQVRQSYQRLFEPITFLMGAPDNVTVNDVYNEVEAQDCTLAELFANEKALLRLRDRMEKRAAKQTRILPKFDNTCRYKINLMPQRYQPDAEVLNELVDAKSKVTRRATPMGLDVMAALGDSAAERILIGELHQDSQWDEYLPTLQKMKQRMGEIDWKETVATRWMEALKVMATSDIGQAPYFMQTPQWQKKNLNTALASWAELKHDAILYAKQPIAAECGGYGPPPPVVKGYVEPNVAFWNKAIELMYATMNLLEKYDLVTEKISRTSDRIREQAEFFLSVSKKELDCLALSDEDYRSIEIIGSTFENISLDLVRDNDQFLMGWDDVQSADKRVSVVADVYTANGDNNPQKSILYEATGPAYEIYVVVEIDNHLYLTRGAVLSYREFTRPLQEPRMTDEEWQEKLKTNPSMGCPSWMDEITVPLKQNPADNEEVFYSSGC